MFNRTLPRSIILAVDTAMVFFSLISAYLIRFNFSIPPIETLMFQYVFPVVILTRFTAFLVVRTHRGLLRYTSISDIQRILVALISGSLFFAILNIITFQTDDFYIVPFSIIIIEFLLTFFLMASFRAMVKILHMQSLNRDSEKTNVIIFGAGESGIITKRTLDRDTGTRYRVVAFVDDNEKKAGIKAEGVPIYETSKHLERLLSEHSVKHLIISIQNLNPVRKKEVIETALKFDTKVLNVPPVNHWINGTLSFKQMKKVNIEDLLEREPIRLDLENIKRQLMGKRVLVTGAAGSIGSELVRQILRFAPEKVILLDSAESPMYELSQELKDAMVAGKAEEVIGDIRNHERMRNVFSTFHPQLVFHAAAYKHVPLMENNPSEAILTNVLGTRIMATLASEAGVEKFVMISTDKAVNPTSIMGASKRIAEIFIQALNRHSDTRFITTRFGNVLGSNGSVIPVFNKQIEERKPLTVTHPDITRYFMTIPEACQLVLEAGAMGKGGEIFIFDMGQSVKIIDLAKKMIQLNGLELGKDIQIVFTGLRPGEKLYEELLANEENTIPTHHEKIMIAQVKEYDFEEVEKNISQLIALFDSQNNRAIVAKMKEIVPEYISNNSVYEALDPK